MVINCIDSCSLSFLVNMADTEFNQILQFIPICAMGRLSIIDAIFTDRFHWFYEMKFNLKGKSKVINLIKNKLFV